MGQQEIVSIEGQDEQRRLESRLVVYRGSKQTEGNEQGSIDIPVKEHTARLPCIHVCWLEEGLRVIVRVAQDAPL